MPFLPNYATSHALVIGINAYQIVQPLSYAVSDAEAVAALLVNHFSFENSHVHLLTDNAATGNAIKKAYLSFANDPHDQNDRLIIFFAGHGHTTKDVHGQDIGYLVPFDGDPHDLSTLVRWDVLTRDACMIRAKHILFFMDACYGGLAITRSLPPGTTRFMRDMLTRRSCQVLTAGKADEQVADLGGPLPNHSVFTGHLLEALGGKAATCEGLITANSVMTYVYAKVASDAGSQQTPHYGFISGDGDFIFNHELL